MRGTEILFSGRGLIFFVMSQVPTVHATKTILDFHLQNEIGESKEPWAPERTCHNAFKNWNN